MTLGPRQGEGGAEACDGPMQLTAALAKLQSAAHIHSCSALLHFLVTLQIGLLSRGLISRLGNLLLPPAVVSQRCWLFLLTLHILTSLLSPAAAGDEHALWPPAQG